MPHEIPECAGSCVCCLNWYPDLRRWKVQIVDGAPLERLWICQGCRDLPREHLTQKIRWNIDHHLYPEDCPPLRAARGAAARRVGAS